MVYNETPSTIEKDTTMNKQMKSDIATVATFGVTLVLVAERINKRRAKKEQQKKVANVVSEFETVMFALDKVLDETLAGKYVGLTSEQQRAAMNEDYDFFALANQIKTK